MTVFNALTLVGGLAFFLFGMYVMSGALERMSGGMLERTLERTTNNRFKAVLLGAAVTALIQSSSATTVMAVGFVNGGIMTLSQASGVIMGANIGTTVTAWILSLTGIEGSSLIVQLLKPTAFSPVLAAIGAAMLLFAKREKHKTVGSILCGFAVLMFGMDLMGDSVAPLAELPEFASVMTAFTNPVLGVIAGAVITGVIQSSAASIGMLQALAMTGGITYGMAIPIIMGQNIGTCVTALLSCIGAGKNAKRTAMVHLYFNLIGTVLFLGIFYIINAIAPFALMGAPITPAAIALIHTVFNLAATAALLPFTDLLCRLATWTIQDKSDRLEEQSPLDDRFLKMPAFALEQCKNVMDRMAALSHETILLALSTVERYDAKTIETVLKNEDELDRYEDRIGDYLVKLSTQKLLQEDSRTIGEYLHVIGDFERIGDHAVNLTETAEEMHAKEITFSAAANEELSVYFAALTQILTLASDAFVEEDAAMARQVEPLEDVIDALHAEIRSRHVARLQQGACTIELGFVLSDLLTNMERVSDHCSNIAACLIQTQQGAFDMHSYLASVKAADGSPEFTERVAFYSGKFRLP